jgi:DNA-binding NtrC family response regulator
MGVLASRALRVRQNDGHMTRQMDVYGPVFLVDDDVAIRQAVSQWLTLAGFEVRVRESASAAFAELTRDFPGILVTDLLMDGLSGRDLLQLSHELDSELPVIVITGHGDAETGADILRLGAFAYMEKPFAPERLLDAVRRASDKRRTALERRNLHGSEKNPSASRNAADLVPYFRGGSAASDAVEVARAGQSD